MLSDPDIQRFIATYKDEMLDHIPPMLPLGEKEHVLVFQDKSIFYTNEYCWQLWLAQDQ
jgi:hypothetical protein